jgi:hypothetical protein
MLMRSTLHVKRKLFCRVKPRYIFRGRHEAKEGHVLLAVVVIIVKVVVIIINIVIVIVIINISSSQIMVNLLEFSV